MPFASVFRGCRSWVLFVSVVADAVRLIRGTCYSPQLLQSFVSGVAIVDAFSPQMPLASVFCGCCSSPRSQMPFASVVATAVRLSCSPCLLQMTFSQDAVRLRLLRMPIVTVTVDAVCLSRCSCRSPQSWQLPFASVVRLCLLQMTVSPDAVRLRLLRMPIVTVTVDAVCLSRCSCRSPQSWQLPFASVVRLCLLQMTVSPDAVRLRLCGCRPSPRLWMPLPLPIASVVRLRLLQMTYSLDAVRLRLSRMPIVTVAVDAVCLRRTLQMPFASVSGIADAVRLSRGHCRSPQLSVSVFCR
jgi:hypothetical protein